MPRNLGSIRGLGGRCGFFPVGSKRRTRHTKCSSTGELIGIPAKGPQAHSNSVRRSEDNAEGCRVYKQGWHTRTVENSSWCFPGSTVHPGKSTSPQVRKRENEVHRFVRCRVGGSGISLCPGARPSCRRAVYDLRSRDQSPGVFLNPVPMELTQRQTHLGRKQANFDDSSSRTARVSQTCGSRTRTARISMSSSDTMTSTIIVSSEPAFASNLVTALT